MLVLESYFVLTLEIHANVRTKNTLCNLIPLLLPQHHHRIPNAYYELVLATYVFGLASVWWALRLGKIKILSPSAGAPKGANGPPKK